MKTVNNLSFLTIGKKTYVSSPYDNSKQRFVFRLRFVCYSILNTLKTL